ncbi:MAG TPA: hypothetical protein VML96_08185, partial [Egibacteraceae bacterium]|nr:hypothetical protein [Egibacteraceae bacterium]
MIRALRLIAVIAAGLTLGAGGSFAVQHVAPSAERESRAALGDSGMGELAIGASGGGAAGEATSPLRRDAPDTAWPDAPLPDTPSPVAPSSPVVPAEPPSERVLLAWVAGGLPEGFAGEVAAISHVDAVTLVRGDLLEMVGSRGAEGRPIDQLAEGSVIPLDAIALEPLTYAAFLPKSSQPAFDELQSGQILLSRTSAALRRLGPERIILLAGRNRLTVTGI